MEVRFQLEDLLQSVDGFVVLSETLGEWVDLRILTDQSRFIQGAIDEVRIYDRALSAAEVATLAAGDAYYFRSSLPHTFENPGSEPCELITACTPPSF